MADRHVADRGGSARNTSLRQGGLAGLVRSIRQVLGGDRTPAPNLLNDHLLQDIGLSRADVQALSL